METQVITIPLTTTIDPSHLLDLALELAERLVGEIESYGEKAVFDEGTVCVERGD